MSKIIGRVSAVVLGASLGTLCGILGYAILGKTPVGLYSEGTIKVNPIKIERQGILWPTTDGFGGLIINNTPSSKWSFTVVNNDASVLKCLKNEEVILTYKKYYILPIRYGNQNQVTSCKEIK